MRFVSGLAALCLLSAVAGCSRASQTAGLKPTTPTTLPPDNGKIITDLSVIQQDEVKGTAITAFWKHQEGMYWVAVQSGQWTNTYGQTDEAGHGDIAVSIVNPVGYIAGPGGKPEPQSNGSINGYGGGSYTTPNATGPLMLTSVTGTLTGRDLTVKFSYSGGSGSLLLPAGKMTLG